MAFKIPRQNYPRDTYFRDRLKSIKPRLGRILDWEFAREYLKCKRADSKHMDEINQAMDDHMREDHICVKIDSDEDIQHFVASQQLMIRPCPDKDMVATDALSGEPCIHVITVKLDTVDHKELISEVRERISKYSDHDKKYIVLVIIVKEEEDDQTKQRMIQDLKELLESHDSNFEVEKCVVTLTTSGAEEESNRPRTRQYSRKIEKVSMETEGDECKSIDVSPQSSPRRRTHQVERNSMDLEGGECKSTDVSPQSSPRRRTRQSERDSMETEAGECKSTYVSPRLSPRQRTRQSERDSMETEAGECKSTDVSPRSSPRQRTRQSEIDYMETEGGECKSTDVSPQSSPRQRTLQSERDSMKSDGKECTDTVILEDPPSHRPITRQSVKQSMHTEEGACQATSPQYLPLYAESLQKSLKKQPSPRKDLTSSASTEPSDHILKDDKIATAASSPPSEQTGAIDKTTPKQTHELDIARAISHQLVCKAIDVVTMTINYLLDLKKRRDRAAGEDLFDELDKFLYELRGLYNISETKVGRAWRKVNSKSAMPTDLTSDLQRLQDVRGFGRIYGNLVFHVNSDEAQESVRQEVTRLTEKHKYNVPFSVKTISRKDYRWADIVVRRG